MNTPISAGDGIAPPPGKLSLSITSVQAKVDLALEALDLANHFGGTWGEHPEHEVGNWAEEIANEDTRLGYWEWVANRVDSGDFDLGDPEPEEAPDPTPPVGYPLSPRPFGS